MLLIIRIYLCCSSKRMAEVNADHTATLHVQHEVREMPVANAQHILTHGHGGQGLDEVRSQGEEGLGGRGQLHEGPTQEIPRNTSNFATVFFLNFGTSSFPVLLI